MESLEPFFVKGITKDHYSYAAGGFCRPGYASEAEKKYKTIDNIVFGPFKDAFTVDFRLANLMKLLAEDEVTVCGASIHIEDCPSEGGGVIGSPHNPPSSAEDTLERISHDSWVLSYAGRLGIFFVTDEGTARIIEKSVSELLKDKLCSDMRIIQDVFGILDERIDNWMVVSDGCGRSKGCVAISSGRRRKINWLD